MMNRSDFKLYDKGYQIVDIDPQTGGRRYPYLRWDDQGVPFSSQPGKWQPDPTDPDIRKAFGEQLLHAALRRGAVAAQWEADTARAQQIAGDPYAGLSEDNENFCTNTLTVSVCPSNFTKISHENGMLCVTNRLAEHLRNAAGNSVLQRIDI